MFLVLDNNSINCDNIENCIQVSNSMLMAERKLYQNIYISNNDKKAYLRKNGKEIQVNIKQIKAML